MTNVSCTVIARVRSIRTYNVKRLGGVLSELNHLRAGARIRFSRAAQSAVGVQLQISHLDDLLGTDVCITRGSSII